MHIYIYICRKGVKGPRGLAQCKSAIFLAYFLHAGCDRPPLRDTVDIFFEAPVQAIFAQCKLGRAPILWTFVAPRDSKKDSAAPPSSDFFADTQLSPRIFGITALKKPK